MNKILEKLINFIYKNSVFVLLFGVFLFIICVYFSLNLEKVIVNKFESSKTSESGITRELINNNFPSLSSDNLVLVLQSKSLTIDDTTFRDYTFKIIENLQKIDKVKSVESSENLGIKVNKNTSFLLISLKSHKFKNTLIIKLRDIISKTQKPKEIEHYLTGKLAYSYDAFLHANKELKKVEKYAVISALIVLIYVFGGIYPALIPLLTGFFCLAIGFTVLYIIAYFSIATSMLQVVVSILSLALGIDYPLFILNRFREEFLKSNNSFESAVIAVKTSGKAVIFSGFIIITGSVYIILTLHDIVWIAPSAICTIAVVLTSIFLGIIIIPAILFTTDKYFNLKNLISHKFQFHSSDKLWISLAEYIKKYPWIILSTNLLIIVLLTLPITNLKIWYPNVTQGENYLESKKGFTILSENKLSGQISPIYILIESDKNNIISKKFLTDLNKYIKNIEMDNRVKKINSIINWNKSWDTEDYLTLYSNPIIFNTLPIKKLINKEFNKTVIMITPAYSPDSDETRELLFDLRNKVNSNFKIFVGGNQAESIDGHSKVKRVLPIVILFNLITIYFILAFFFKSAIIPIKAIITNLMPIFASLGLVIMVFQYGYGAELIGAEKNGYIMSLTPITLFTVLFGISIDYEVMILSRIKETYDRTHDNTQAVIEGITKSGKVIIGAALIMLSVFGAYIFSNVNSMKEISLGLFTAVLIEASIVRLIVVPSTMMVMGEWNYWHPFKKKKP